MTGILLPWVRRGLARGIGDVDDRTGGALDARGEITGTVELVDSNGTLASAETTLTMVGPGDVVGFDASQIARHEPPHGAIDVEANYFPFVELVSPDLPWMLTPARADEGNAVRPWLVLVCVEERTGVAYDAAGVPLPILRVDAELVDSELPDLAESWAWAHVHSLVPGPDIDDEVVAGSGAVTARMMCPRRLRDGKRYRAAIVPAFEAGRLAGLGVTDAAPTQLEPAWPSSDPNAALELPVYDSWTFTTATSAGDFETLARRLEPDTEDGRIGYRPARIVDVGLLEPFEKSTDFDYAGALVSPGTRPAGLSKTARTWFGSGMRERVDEAATRGFVRRKPPSGYSPAEDDPVVGPPMYGGWAAGRSTLPRRGWLAEANLVPDRRTAAGLGAEVVRRHQHELLAAAWDQAGDLNALRAELNRGRLAAEIGRSHQRKFAALDDADVLSVTGRLHVFSHAGSTTTAQQVAASVIVPTAMASVAYLRRTRAGGTLSRRAGSSTAGPAVGRRAVERFVAASTQMATRSDALEPVATFGSAFAPSGAITADTEWLTADAIDVALPLGLIDGDPIPHHVIPVVDSPSSDLTNTAMVVREALDPMTSIVQGLDSRISGLDLDLSAALPTRVTIGAKFPDPLYPWLHALGSEVVVPGVDDFGVNRVRLLEVNEAWIAAFLIGANHEWAREALWNEYPADLGATSFSTFWNRIPIGEVDMTSEIHTWSLSSDLGSHVGAADGTSTVLLIRGDLIARHPDTEFYLVSPTGSGDAIELDGTIAEDRTLWPAFHGQLDHNTRFVGFDVEPDFVRSEGWFVAIQEPETGPRFGLDTSITEHHGQIPGAWSDLSWGHTAADATAFETTTHVHFATIGWPSDLDVDGDGRTWARNSGHQAAITYQTPFRLIVAAEYLMPDAPTLRRKRAR